MALSWHLADALDRSGLALSSIADALEACVDDAWLEAAPPEALTIADLATLCSLLGCQPGDLLGFAPASPADQAALNLANDLFYQSFLSHRAALDEEL